MNFTNRRTREPVHTPVFRCPCGQMIRGKDAYSAHKISCVGYATFIQRMRGRNG